MNETTSRPVRVLLEEGLPVDWPREIAADGRLGIHVYEANAETRDRLAQLFPDALESGVSPASPTLVRAFKEGALNPLASSLAAVLGIPESRIRVDRLVVSRDAKIPSTLVERLEGSWREPAIEDLSVVEFSAWENLRAARPRPPVREDDSFSTPRFEEIGLEFSPDEARALAEGAARRGRPFTRAELELFAQTWSEHCKHKIFGADITTRDTRLERTPGLFKTHIRAPSVEVLERKAGLALSIFVDNAGVLSLYDETGQDTDWAFCLKMETHNSPSAISPYGGASTGLVGVHRDILGTGLGALPIANWDVLCFEEPEHGRARPAKALPPDVIRRGVLKGIEDGGNQSGIPTVQGSIVFHPDYAVKPLVYAGSVGLLPKRFVAKRPRPGLKLYCFGGATGADGLRGAVMSSRDLRGADFGGSAVQVANAFVQRRMTDFLIEARDAGFIDVVTDNGAGGLASSVGEMATLAERPGARIDVTNLRLKFEGLLGWERLVSESQERMTVATSQPEKLEALAQEWKVEFDRLGELTDTGRFEVFYQGRPLVDLPLELLHEACPKLRLESSWTRARESAALANEGPAAEREVRLLEDFPRLLASVHGCSREEVVRRFDHEVQGRTLRKPFGGRTQRSPQDGAVIEIPEAGRAAVVLGHGLAPWRTDIVENTLHSFDEALRSAVLGGADLKRAGGLDNFSWSDPIPSAKNPEGERRLWRLVRCCETLASLVRGFEMPLVSGKDSMKNNSADFAAPQTLVVSVGASARSRTLAPAGFFSRANDVLFMMRPLRASLRDSLWERALDARAPASLRGPHLRADDLAGEERELASLVEQLRERHSTMSDAVAGGLLRSAKDISEGGLLAACFEMSLGRGLGIFFERDLGDTMLWLGEGFGGYVFGVDPHLAGRVERLPGVERLGVVVNVPQLRFKNGESLDIVELRDAYVRRGEEGFFA